MKNPIHKEVPLVNHAESSSLELHLSHSLSFIVIDNYDSFTYNLVQYLQRLGVHVKVIRNDATTAESLILDWSIDAFIISPGPSTPSEAGLSIDLVHACLEHQKPLLGVCLGHQAIGQAFGGIITRIDPPVHGKVSRIFHQNMGVFRDLPNPIQATRYHSLVIDRNNLPSCLQITATLEPDLQGEIMGVRHKEGLIEGVQFHPESVLTDLGINILENFVDEVRTRRDRPNQL